MEVLKLEKGTAKKLFKQVPEWFQETLISSFGAECFTGNIMDQIKTFGDAYKEADEPTRSEYEINVRSGTHSDDVVAYSKLKLIAKVINEGWTPNWDDTNEKKWWPWFRLSSGFGFVDSLYTYTITYAAVGSRLCFKTKELSDYVATQFIDLYKDFLTLNK